MKRRYFYKEGTPKRAEEEELFKSMPDEAVEYANSYIDQEFGPWARLEIKERVLVVYDNARFCILTESISDYKAYKFLYDNSSGHVSYDGMEGDWKH